MGVVYLATHETTGRRVAIKTSPGADPRRQERLAREIGVVRTLDHPGVVSLVDHGTDDGTPWLAMELLAGRTLAKQMESVGDNGSLRPETAETRLDQSEHGWASAGPWIAAGDVSRPPGNSSNFALHRANAPETQGQRKALRGPDGHAAPMRDSRSLQRAVGSSPEEHLLGLVGELCHAVAYLHGEGLVHGDIKPDNIFITSGGRPVLMDFGLAAETEGRIDPLALERVGQRAGTVWYISPEQIRGQWADARADLYAIGCILFEIVAGEPPFRHKDPQRVLRDHLSAKPPLHELEGAPAPLRRIIERLLDKRLERRPTHALQVVEALEAAGISVPTHPDAPEPEPYLLRAPLVGRAGTYDALVEALGSGLEGDGSLHLVTGPSGVGKTRLALEISREARERGYATLGGRCATLGSRLEPAAPLHAFRAFGHRLARLGARSPDELARILGEAGPLLAPYFPELVPFVTVDARRRAPVSSEDGKQAVVEAFIETLKAWADQSPILLMLDDVQWADELSAAVVKTLAQRKHEYAWVILALAPDPHVDWVSALVRRGISWHRLGNLDEAGTEAILRASLGTDSLPAGLVTAIQDQTNGNPFEIGESVRALIDAGALLYQRGKWTTGSRVDTSLTSLATSRVARLPEEARTVCAAAATLGTHFEEGVLREVAGLADDAFQQALGTLLRGQILGVEDFGLTFIHDSLRNATLEMTQDAAGLQLRAAEALASRNGPLHRQAHHLDRAGRRDLARGLYWRAALQAHSAFALRDAERLFRRAITIDDRGDAVSADIQCDFAERILVPLGSLEEAEGMLGVARRQARTEEAAELECRILMLLGEVYERQGMRQAARRSIQDALRIAKSVGDIRAEARALNVLGESFRTTGEVETAQRLFQVARTAFEQVGDRAGMVSVANNLAIVHRRRGNYGEARELYREALSHYESTNDLAGIGRIKSNLAVIHVVTGEHEEAQTLLFEALALRRESGDIGGEAATLDNLAELHRQRGALEQAARLQRDALALHEQLGDTGSAAWARKRLADIAYWNDELVEAEAAYQQALIALEGGDSHARLMTLVGLGAVQRDLGKVFDASRHFADALSGARAAGDLRAQAQALLHRGRLGRYLTELQHAETDLRGAHRAFSQLRDAGGCAQALCELGHIALSRGNTAAEFHEKAAKIIARQRLGVTSEVGRRVLELERSIVAREGGERLVLGQREADLPSEIRNDHGGDFEETKTLSVD